jgi:hypothetical protein
MIFNCCYSCCVSLKFVLVCVRVDFVQLFCVWNEKILVCIENVFQQNKKAKSDNIEVMCKWLCEFEHDVMMSDWVDFMGIFEEADEMWKSMEIFR